MKKLFLMLSIAVAFAYCNPSQQTSQTTGDSMTVGSSGTTARDTGTMRTDTGSMRTDTGSTRTDTTRPR